MTDSIKTQLSREMQDLVAKRTASANAPEKVVKSLHVVTDVGDSIVSTNELVEEDDMLDTDLEESEGEDVEADDTQESPKELINIFSVNCTNCGYFVAHLDNVKTAQREKCRVEDGNDLCPAQHSRVVIAPDFERASTGLAEAWMTNNLERFHKNVGKLLTYDTAISDLVVEMSKRKLRKLLEIEESTDKPLPSVGPRGMYSGRVSHRPV